MVKEKTRNGVGHIRFNLPRLTLTPKNKLNMVNSEKSFSLYISDMENVWLFLSKQRDVLNDRFIMAFSTYLYWDELSKHYEFSIDMLRIYQHRVMWEHLLKRQKFDERFLREMAVNFTSQECWQILSQYQRLSMEFIHDFAEKLDWSLIELYQLVPNKFLEDHSLYVVSEEEKSDSSVEDVNEDDSQGFSDQEWNQYPNFSDNEYDSEPLSE